MARWRVSKVYMNQNDTVGSIYSPSYIKGICELTWGSSCFEPSRFAQVSQYSRGHSSHMLVKALHVDTAIFLHYTSI